METPDLSRLYRDHVAALTAGYATALADSGYDAVVVDAGAPAKKSRFDDQYWPHRPTPSFAHWLPLEEPDAVLIVRAGESPRVVRTVAADFWEGPPPAPDEGVLDLFEVDEVDRFEAIGERIPRGVRLAFVGEDSARARAWGIDASDVNPDALIAAVEELRVHKSGYEIECIAEANRRALRGHARAFEVFRSGAPSELELHLGFLEASHQDDADTPYKNIVALGANASVLHHVCYQRHAARPTDSLLVDAGATFRGYASDITRTEVKGDGDAADRFRALITHLRALQARVCGEVRTGANYEELHDLAHVLLAPILRDLGIARGSDEQLVATGVTRRFFPHGLGHSLGVQVHDVGCRPRAPRPENPFLRHTRDIEVGQVFTIEPGCYFIDGLLAELRAEPAGDAIDWDVVDSLRAFGGVRIEDNVAVTASGTRNLTRDNDSPTP